MCLTGDVVVLKMIKSIEGFAKQAIPRYSRDSYELKGKQSEMEKQGSEFEEFNTRTYLWLKGNIL